METRRARDPQESRNNTSGNNVTPPTMATRILPCSPGIKTAMEPATGLRLPELAGRP